MSGGFPKRSTQTSAAFTSSRRFAPVTASSGLPKALPRDQVDLRMPYPKPMRDDRASPRQEVADRLLLPGDPAPVALVGPLRRIGSDTASHRRKPTDPPPVDVTETMPTGPYQRGARKSERGTSA